MPGQGSVSSCSGVSCLSVSPSKPKVFVSCLMLSIQLTIGLPLTRVPLTLNFIVCYTLISSPIRRMSPYLSNMACLAFNVMLTTTKCLIIWSLLPSLSRALSLSLPLSLSLSLSLPPLSLSLYLSICSLVSLMLANQFGLTQKVSLVPEECVDIEVFCTTHNCILYLNTFIHKQSNISPLGTLTLGTEHACTQQAIT